MFHVYPSTTYALLVYSAGFLCGIIRTPFLEPCLGVRTAQFLEISIMLAAIWLSADFVIRKSRWRCDYCNESVSAAADCLYIGFGALIWMLCAEVTIAALLKGRSSVWAYLRQRDEVAGPVYLMMLGVFALMPLWLGKM